MRTIRVFISSPSDVGAERDAAQRVLERLQRSYRDVAEIEHLLWENLTYDAGSAFHDQIPLASTYDIVVILLWSRLGSPINVNGVQYQSGTEFEFQDVAKAGRMSSLLVFRKTTPLNLSIDTPENVILEAKADRQRVTTFFDQHFVGFAGGLRGFNTFDATADFEERLDHELERRIDALLGADNAPARDQEVASPYKGLRLFDQDDQHVFHGRTRARHAVFRAINRQHSAGKHFLAIVGRSGVGKSSFVRAGVVPDLTGTRVVPGVKEWRIALFEPSDSTVDLIGGLAAAVCAEEALPSLADADGSATTLAGMLRRDAAGGIAMIRKALGEARAGDALSKRLLLIIDPLEEAFTHGAAKRDGSGEQGEAAVTEDQKSFAKVLNALCTSGAVWAIATLRRDFLEQTTSLPALRELIEGEGHYHLAALTATEISQAVLRPAQSVRLKFETDKERGDLAEELVNQALVHTEPMPLLSYTLEQLFEQSKAGFTRLMTFKAFDDLGGVDGALSRRADMAKDTAARKIGAGFQDAWNRVFGRLVEVDVDGRRVRTYALAEDLRSDSASATLLDELDSARLLITDKDDQQRPVITIAHEAMLRQWQSLRSWIDDRAETLRLKSSLGTEAKAWAATRHPDQLLLHGARLLNAEQFVAQAGGVEAGDQIRTYVRANVEQRDHLLQAKKQRVRLVVTALATLALAAMVALAVAMHQSRVAKEQTQQAQVNFGIARQATKHFTTSMLRLQKDAGWKLQLDDPYQRQMAENIADQMVEFCKDLGDSAESAGVRLEIADGLASFAKSIAVGTYGLYRQASGIMDRSISIYQDAGSPDKSVLADRYAQEGAWCINAAEYERAGRLLDTALDLYKSMGNQVSPAGLVARGSKQQLLKTQGRYSLYAHLERELIKQLKEAKPDSLDLAKQYDYHADILRNLGGFAGEDAAVLLAESESASKEAIRIAKQFNKLEDGAAFEAEYAVLLGMTDRVNLAQEMLSRVVKTCKDNKFEQSKLGSALYKLARIQIEHGQVAEAGELLKESYGCFPDQKHTRFAKCLAARAAYYIKLNKPALALEDAIAVIAIREAKFGPFNPDVAEGYSLKAKAQDLLGNADGAKESYAKEAKVRDEFRKNEAKDQADIAAGKY